MPPSPGKLTSRSVIDYIKSRNKSFTLGNLTENLAAFSAGKSKVSRKKKHKTRKKQKDTDKILSILSALTSAGFLRKKKKSYIKNSSFKTEGPIRINSSGNGFLKWDDDGDVHINRENTASAHNRDLVEVEIIDFKRGFLYGRVNRIIQKQREFFLGSVKKVTGELVFFTLLDTPAQARMCAELPLREASVIAEESGSKLYLLKGIRGKILNVQKCRIVNSYNREDNEADFQRISVKNNLPGPHPDYPELQGLDLSISEKDISGRKDYRGLLTVTIDGEDAKDFDDAVSLVIEGDQYRLFVHIADVSHYVARDTPLDREAMKRGTSFYIGNKVVPMLPELLSNNLCSLVEGKERLTVSVEMVYDSKGNLVSSEFQRGLIKSNRRLTYKIAEKILSHETGGEIHDLLSNMYRLASLLKKKRLKSGRIDLNLKETKLIYDNGNFRELAFGERLRSHEIIEEFMLSANVAVAMRINREGRPSLHRNHEKISSEKIVTLGEFLKLHNLFLDRSGNLGVEIQRILQKVKGKFNEQVINLVVLKSMMQAFYSGVPLGHFGLGFKDYTHFTSPIRRYPDLVVHRCLTSIIDGTGPPYTFEEIMDTGEKNSEMERVAQEAERDMIKVKSCRFMEGCIGETFSGVISGVARFGIFISLDRYPVEGLIPLRMLTDDYYLFEEDMFRITSKKYSKRFTIGDSVQVKLVDVDTCRLRIDFDLAF